MVCLADLQIQEADLNRATTAKLQLCRYPNWDFAKRHYWLQASRMKRRRIVGTRVNHDHDDVGGSGVDVDYHDDPIGRS